MLISVIVTFCLVYVSFIYSIHDGLRIAGYLFPYAVLISPTLDSLGALSMFLAAVQFPLYGLLIGLCWRNRTLLALCCGLIVLSHFAASMVAERAVENAPIRIISECHVPTAGVETKSHAAT
jgi:hypothetical protein